VAVYGRPGGLQTHELLAMAGEFADPSGWVTSYEAGLAYYRARDFDAAIKAFEKVVRRWPPEALRVTQRADGLCRNVHMSPPLYFMIFGRRPENWTD
jgi:hypothetical protein